MRLTSPRKERSANSGSPATIPFYMVNVAVLVLVALVPQVVLWPARLFTA
jgi:TRAP-type C4-dicarboxylate transport system permease large subunit